MGSEYRSTRDEGFRGEDDSVKARIRVNKLEKGLRRIGDFLGGMSRINVDYIIIHIDQTTLNNLVDHTLISIPAPYLYLVVRF